jgi:anti-sigma regulatory factor (Ser/Thr protein kinase)
VAEPGTHRTSATAARTAATRLPIDVTSPRRARHFLRERLHEWGLLEFADSAELMVSELVTNAIVHAHSASMLVARADGGTLRVEVEDWGRGVCTMRNPDTEAASGRGLRFVDALAHRWGTASTPRGKTVWFELART